MQYPNTHWYHVTIKYWHSRQHLKPKCQKSLKSCVFNCLSQSSSRTPGLPCLCALALLAFNYCSITDSTGIGGDKLHPFFLDPFSRWPKLSGNWSHTHQVHAFIFICWRFFLFPPSCYIFMLLGFWVKAQGREP